MATRKNRNFAIIGLGMFGGTVAATLASMGEEVLGIDLDEARVRHYSDKLSQTVIADARDDEALKEAGLAEYDVALVAIGEDLEANILGTMNAKLIGVPCVWVKAFSRTHHRILSRIGVERVIHPERDMGLHIAEMLHTPFVAGYVSLGNGFHVVDLVIQEDMSPESLKELAANGVKDVHVLGLMRGTDYLDSKEAAFDFKQGDRVLVLGRREDLRQLGERL